MEEDDCLLEKGGIRMKHGMSVLVSSFKWDTGDGDVGLCGAAYVFRDFTSRTKVDQCFLDNFLVLPSVSTTNSILSACRSAMMA